MATARREPIPQPKEQIVLTMSMEEAEVVRGVLGICGGDPITTPRGIMDKVIDALDDAEVSLKYGISAFTHTTYWQAKR